MPENKKKESRKKVDTQYAHNPHYCMILPDATNPDEEGITSTGES